MARILSNHNLQSFLANETEEIWTILIAVSHSLWPVPKRFALSRVAVVSRSDTYFPAYFDLSLPDQTPNQLPRWQITIDNIDQTILSEMRAVDSAPGIRLDLVRLSDPNTVVMTTGDDYKIKSYSYTLATIIFEISMEDLIGQGFPGPRFQPSNFPGTF